MAKHVLVAEPEPRYCPHCGDEAREVGKDDLGEGTEAVWWAECSQGHTWPIDSYRWVPSH